MRQLEAVVIPFFQYLMVFKYRAGDADRNFLILCEILRVFRLLYLHTQH